MTSPSLHDLQRWVQTVTTHPDGVRKGAKKMATLRGALRGRQIQQIVERSQQLTAAERVSIYADMYFIRLIDCLRNDYPVLLKILGDEHFEALCRSYLVKCPPRHYSMNHLGAEFPNFLKRTKERIAHRAILYEIAAVERAIEEVFDAREETPLSVDELLSIKPRQWLAMRLKCSEALQLFRCDYPVNTVIESIKTGKAPSFPKRSPSCLAVYRNDYTVWRLDLDEWKYSLLTSLKKGLELGAAIERSLKHFDSRDSDAADKVKSWFEFAAQRGWFVGIRSKA